jgi:hypothetical protein
MKSQWQVSLVMRRHLRRIGLGLAPVAYLFFVFLSGIAIGVWRSWPW